MPGINIDDLSLTIAEYLSNYSENVTEGIKKAVDTVAVEVDREVKNRITFKEHTGEYVKAFRIKKTYEDKFNRRKTWYVANGQHRLTHLLENGHALRNGGRSEKYPHIIYGEELAKSRLEALSKEAIENVKT